VTAKHLTPNANPLSEAHLNCIAMATKNVIHEYAMPLTGLVVAVGILLFHYQEAMASWLPSEWSPSQVLFIKASVAALTSGLGGFPLYLVGELPDHLMGLSITFAAGLMSGCSMVLFLEALAFEPSLLTVCLYFAFGVAVIDGIGRLIGDIEDFEFGGLRGQSASKCLLIVVSMCLHSLGEGISVGVSAMAEREHIGLLVVVSLAIHNIPEGIAVSLLLMNQGMGVWMASLFAIVANIPQPLMAIPAFLFLDAFSVWLPVGYGLASGAMTYIVFTELVPEAKDKISRSMLASTFLISLGFVVAISLCG